MRALFATVVCVFISAAAVAQDAAPMILPEKLKQIAPSVWIIPDENRPMVPNVGFVVGQTGVLVVDTGMGDKNGAIVAAVARKLAPDLRIYLVTTHIHPEHDLGANGFPRGARMLDGSTLLRSTVQELDVAEFGAEQIKSFMKISPATAELLKGAAYRDADISFENDRTLDLGGVRAYIFAAGPNHTRGDTAVWVETEQVLFAGDIAMQRDPSLGSPFSSVDHWLSTLDSLTQLRARTIVPSHGPVGGQELINGYKTYFTEIKERTAAEKKAGKSVEDAVNAVAAAMADRHPNKNRLARAIRSAYSEAP